MKGRLSVFGILVVLIAIALTIKRVVFADAGKPPPGHVRLELTVDGTARSCLVYFPPKYRKELQYAVVLMLHGMGGTAANAVRETGWSAMADQGNFIAIYPEATRPDPSRAPSLGRNPPAWNDGSGRFHAAESHVADVSFIENVIEHAVAIYGADHKRVYVTGFSNGASMAFRLAAELSNRIAAVAPCAGTCWVDPSKLSRGVSLCYITGKSDTLNPIEGGFPKLAMGGKEQGGKPKPPVETFVQKWVQVLHTGPE
jgi:polyhydroxybutyrate depolymerase